MSQSQKLEATKATLEAFRLYAVGVHPAAKSTINDLVADYVGKLDREERAAAEAAQKEADEAEAKRAEAKRAEAKAAKK
jgi:hypothetical protein